MGQHDNGQPNELREVQKGKLPKAHEYNALIRQVRNNSATQMHSAGKRVEYVECTPDANFLQGQLVVVDAISSEQGNNPFGATASIAEADSVALAVSDDYDMTSGTPAHVRLLGFTIPAMVRCDESTDVPVEGEECGVIDGGLVGASGSGLFCLGQPSTGIAWVVKTGGAGGSVKWGTVGSDVLEWAVSGCTTVDVIQATDCETPDAEGEAFTVVLPEIDTAIPNLHTGDIIAFAEVESDAEETEYSCVSDYTLAAGGNAIVVAINGDIGQWVFTPGCQTVSGDIVVCSGSNGEDVGDTVDVIIPNLNQGETFVVSGDYITAAPTDITTDPKKYVITSDYSKSSSSAVVVSLNGDIGQWLNVPGCTKVSGDIVICSGSNGDNVGDTVDVIVPNLNSRLTFVVSGDYVTAAPSDLTASPPTYVITSDYSKSELPEVRPFTLTASLAGGSAAATFDDNVTVETLTAVDRNGVYAYGESGDSGYVAWVIRAGQWEIIDFPCDDGLGGS